MTLITKVVIHHGGSLIRLPRLKYVGGKSKVVYIDKEELSWDHLERVIRELGYTAELRIFVKDPHSTLDRGLRLVFDEITPPPADLLTELGAKYMELYVEHKKERLDSIDLGSSDVWIENATQESACVTQAPIQDTQVELPHVKEKGKGKEKVKESGKDNAAIEESDTDSDYVFFGDSEDEEEEEDYEGLVSENVESEDEDGVNHDINTIGGKDSVPTMEANSDIESRDELRSLPSDNEEENTNESKCPQFNAEKDLIDPKLVIGMEFANPNEFRNLLRYAAVTRGFDVCYEKNEGGRIIVTCKAETCPWRCYGSWNSSKTKWQIKSLRDSHDCARVLKNSQATSTWLANVYLMQIKDNPNWKLDSLKKTIKRDYDLELNDYKVYRIRKKARKIIEGSYKLQYTLLWDYANMLMKKNPNSVVRVKTTRRQLSDPNIFFGFFVAYKACIDGFRLGCRPVIGLDGCFLKGPAGGVLLSAVSRDGNNQMFPLAVAVVQNECEDTWSWFVETLLEAIGDQEQNGWVYISDRQKVSMYVNLHLLFQFM